MSFFGISMPQNMEIHQNLEIDFLDQCNTFSIEKVKKKNLFRKGSVTPSGLSAPTDQDQNKCKIGTHFGRPAATNFGLGDTASRGVGAECGSGTGRCHMQTRADRGRQTDTHTHNIYVQYICIYIYIYIYIYQGRALWVGKVGSAYLKQNNQVPHFPSGVQLGT